MATRRRSGRARRRRGSGTVEAPPTAHAGAGATAKDAPRTMKDLRLRGSASEPRGPSRSRTSCARASAWRGSRIRRSSCCSAPPATWPIARSSRRSTTCGGPNLLPHEFLIVAIGRRPFDDETFRAGDPRLAREVQPHPAARRGGLAVVRGADLPTSSSTSRTRPGSTPWRRASTTIDEEHGDARQPAVLPRHPARRSSPRSSAQLGRVGLDHERHDGGWRRVVIEKPFGHDLDSAKRLNREVGKVFRESQVYRIDHYLGKETVRNLLVFRFGNGIFEPLWNRRYVDHVQITVAESIGIENRGAFYEQTGASRDVLQNHLLQLVSLVAMEPPATFDANALRDEKVKVLRAISSDPLDPATRRRPRPVRPGLGGGHPGAGLSRRRRRSTRIGDRDVRRRPADDRRLALVGRAVLRADRQAPAEARDRDRHRSTARSRTGCSRTRASPPTRTCWPSGSSPTRGSCCASGPRCPGLRLDVRSVTMDFTYGSAFNVDSPDAYETLILDALQGDASLFTRADEVEEAWGIVDPIIDAWADAPPPDFPNYDAGTWGPDAADDLPGRDGRHWRRF